MQRPYAIAIVGISGVFPGANDADQFWNNILHKQTGISDIPDHRWILPPELALNGKSEADRAFSKKAGLIHNFIPNYSSFRLDAELIRNLDPLYSLVLHAGRSAYQDCCHEELGRDKTGVVLAAIALPTESASALTQNILGSAIENRLFNQNRFKKPNASQYMAARVTALPAALLANELGLEGIAFTLDAACASSLYAVKLACDELASGRADAMLAGGVSRPDCLYTQMGFSRLQALSPSGRCAPFDKSADGLVVGEGVGIVVLKRLPDALQQGDKIYGIIRGIGLSNDLRGNLLAPETAGQLRAMTQAYQQAGWSPSDVDLVECHGAGTPVGDLVEIRSLAKLWEQAGGGSHRCAIGSVKSMIGHLLTAAGAAGMIKTLLALKHQILPPSLNFSSPPHESPLNDCPLRVQREPEPWQERNPGRARRAAVSAFGFGGINAHLLLEEWRPENTFRPAYRVEISTRDKEIPPSRPFSAAVVGMAASYGLADTLDKFKQTVLAGENLMQKRPSHRWHGVEGAVMSTFHGAMDSGGYIGEIPIGIGEFRIPPSEIQEILPQHLLMLKTAAAAIADAGIEGKHEMLEAAAIIGIAFDMEAANFHLRWFLPRLFKKYGLAAKIPETLTDQCCPPLTAPRVVGALGSIIASRISREFRFGGPCFTVSEGPASGLRALEIALDLLKRKEADRVLIGAVDLPCDVRKMLSLEHFTCKDGKNAHFFSHAEGAGALVLKPLENAVADKDRIYAVIRGTGSATGWAEDNRDRPSETTIVKAMERAAANTGSRVEDLEYIELATFPEKDNGSNQFNAIRSAFPETGNSDFRRTLGMSKFDLGYCGAASGMGSLIKAILSVWEKTLPGFRQSEDCPIDLTTTAQFQIPVKSSPWNPEARSCNIGVLSPTPDGACTQVVLEAFPSASHPDSSKKPMQQSRMKTFDQQIQVRIGELPKVSDLNPLKHTVDNIEPAPALIAPSISSGRPDNISEEWIRELRRSASATADAHSAYLELSSEMIRMFAENLEYQVLHGQQTKPEEEPPIRQPHVSQSVEPAFSREQCMEFAIGSVEKVLGPQFATVDSFRARVRLPDEPLMLVDRILSVQGEKGSLGGGRIVTEHDVHPGAWYLDGDRAPVCISVEAGQADLFLCAYLGIDLRVKGIRTYRLLDATVTFHRGLPQPGELIRYEIEIDKFVRQGDTYLFFFHFEGFIGEDHLITMTNGCAGFFTPEEVQNSGGIIFTESEKQPVSGKKKAEWPLRLPRTPIRYDDSALEALRAGDIEKAFGEEFKGIRLPLSQQLPGGRMRLIDRVLEIDPKGGRYGLGMIRAEADIHPDDWFLTCHFVDDKVMPGTLMYECCAHTLRVMLQRMGWIIDTPGITFEPLIGTGATLKCRGPVTPETHNVHYEVELKEIGHAPEPYVIADAHMYADGHQIVFFRDMSMKLTGTTGAEINAFWQKRRKEETALPVEPVFTKEQILQYAYGSPVAAFGPAFQRFEDGDFLARLPSPPYSFLDRIVTSEHPPLSLKPNGWVTGEFDVQPEAWYFRANQSDAMPFCVLLESVLQSCGWLAAYMGTALQRDFPLKFRNLSGTAVLHRDIVESETTLIVKTRLHKLSMAGDMILQNFDIRILDTDGMIYEGETGFGFFTEKALAEGAGIQEGSQNIFWRPEPEDWKGFEPVPIEKSAPLSPEDTSLEDGEMLGMPSGALCMIDQIDLYLPEGGPNRLGFVRGSKTIRPDEWFFKAHFFQDPVWPGSLGIEAFIQLIRYAALNRWPEMARSARLRSLTGQNHNWIYRGQVLQSHKKVEVDAYITEVKTDPFPCLKADGRLIVDGMTIYKMENFGCVLVPEDPVDNTYK